MASITWFRGPTHARRSVTWLALNEGEYRPIERSGLIDLGASQLAELIDWPPEDPSAQ